MGESLASLQLGRQELAALNLLCFITLLTDKGINP